MRHVIGNPVMSFMRISMLVIAAVMLWAAAQASDVFDIVFKPRYGGEIVFSHDIHTSNPKIADNCPTCHEKIYKTKSKKPVTMAQMEKGKSCGACHGRIAFPLSACGRCHGIRTITFAVPYVGNVNFLHKPHTDKFPCGECHNKLFFPGRNPHATMAEMEKGKSCGACHRGKKAFALRECSRCHLAGNLLMKCVNAGPVTFSHGYHTKLYRCTDCHQKIFPLDYSTPRVSMHEMESGKSCGACHDDYTAFTIRENCVRCHDM